jgi:hypothetical protein
MAQCLASVEEGESLRGAARNFGFVESTVRRHWHSIQSGIPRALPGAHSSLPPQVELDLATVVKVASRNGFGYTMEEIKSFVGAFVLDQWNKDTEVGNYLRSYCRFNKHDRCPGKDWMESFMRTHHLSLKKPSPLEKARKAAESNPFRIYNFYDIMERTVAELNLCDRPDCIWNLDESPFWIDPKSGKVVGEVGVKTQRVVSGCGRTCISVMGCVSASGGSIPPMFIFEGKHLYASWKGTSPDIPPDTTYACSGKSPVLESSGTFNEPFNSNFKAEFFIREPDI